MENVKTGTPANPEAINRLRMDLFAPGMTLLHRAGLGGLACSLRAIDRAYQDGRLTADEVPGGPWPEQQPPWKITAQEITLDFGKAEQASDFLKRLFRIAFAVKDGMIYLPGQYDQDPPLVVRAELQNGLTLTFLQHGRVRKLDKDPTLVEYDPDGTGVATVRLEYKKCSGYRHQEGWSDLVDRKGRLAGAVVEVGGPLNPGAMVRHNAFAADTKIEDPPERLLPLYFALVGCLALPVNRGVGVLIVPGVTDLLTFARMRPLMTPTSAKECRITSAGDAALQAQVRLWNKVAIAANDLPACYAMTLRPTPWATQQKSRVATLHVPPGEERRLEQFAKALAELAPRVVTRKRKQTQGRGKQKTVVEHQESFWVDSNVRPLVADNLALGRPWYAGFTRLMIAIDNSGTPIRDKLPFERKGLHAMTENKIFWEQEGETIVVKAVHRAISNSLGRIKQDTDGPGNAPPSQATKNRWDRFKERLRLALVGAKTADQCRNALCTLFGNAGPNSELQRGWPIILPMLSDKNWQKARDLALLALASYAGKGGAGADEPPQSELDGGKQ
jgi:CRISPR-associated protein Cas8a1/Csx13